MTDSPPVTELDAPTPASPLGDRAVPWLWAVVAGLLIAGVVSTFVVAKDDERDPGERLAAAGAGAAEEDFAFEAGVEGIEGLGELTVVGDVDVETGRVRATFGNDQISVELIQDGTIQYVKVPQAAVDGGKPWRRLDLAALGVPAGQEPTGGNPLDAYAQLGAIVGDVERVGEEEVRGVDTVHFRTVVDATKTSSRPLGTVPEALRRVPVDVWLDDEDRPRRFRQRITLPAEAGGMEIVTTVESYDYGKDVAIELPPPDQVEELSDFGSLFAPAAPAD